MTPLRRSYFLLFLLFLFPLLPTAASQSPTPDPIRPIEWSRQAYDGNPAATFLHLPQDTPLPLEAITPNATPSHWSKVAFQSYRNNNWDIYLVTSDGSNELRLTAEASGEFYPALQPGAARLNFTSNRDGNYEIYALDSDGTDLARLTNDPADDYLGDWSPNGSQIAFQADRTGNSDIYVMNSNGSGVVPLTDSAAYDGHPDWSPDGAQIVFTSNRTGRYELWVMNANGSNQHQITFGATALYPAWSPNGSKIAYANDSNGDGWLEIWWINPDGSGAQLLVTASGYVDTWAPAWSPDSNWITFNQTFWIFYQGAWYWTASYLRLKELYGPGLTNLVSDDRVWNSDWVSADLTAPGPCTLTLPSRQTWQSFIVRFSADDVGPAGIANYDLQLRYGPALPWLSYLNQVSQPSTLYQGTQEYVEFRCRARDHAGNVAAWETSTPVSAAVDTTLPRSTILPLPALLRADDILVHWTGADTGAGLAHYDIWSRDGVAGDWTIWRDNTTATSATFSGTPGHTYYFRSQAHDHAQHTEPWQPAPQAQVTFYTHAISGTITDNRGRPVVAPTLTVAPDPAAVTTDPLTGDYAVYLGTAGVYELAAVAPGSSPIPTTTLTVSADLALPLALLPQVEQVTNGSFETANLSGWTLTGSGAQASPPARHTGNYGLQLTHALSDTTILSQTVYVSPGLHEPTLSFFYLIPAGLTGGQFTARIVGSTTSTALETAAATNGWQHIWADLSDYSNQNVVLILELAAAGRNHDLPRPIPLQPARSPHHHRLKLPGHPRGLSQPDPLARCHLDKPDRTGGHPPGRYARRCLRSTSPKPRWPGRLLARRPYHHQ